MMSNPWQFKKGQKAWNKGKSASWAKGNKHAKGHEPWNKGLKTGLAPKTAFKKGLIPWNKGKVGVYTDKVRESIRQALKGKKLSEETRKAMSNGARRGSKNHNWKGGITAINVKIRNSLEYKLWREAVFKRDNYTCIWCLRKEEVS